MKNAHYPGSARPEQIRWRTAARPLALVFAATLLCACGSSRQAVKATPINTGNWPQSAPTNPAQANAVVMRALSLVGTPYHWGGNTPESGFDCSGLVTYVFRDMLDLRLPRTSHELAAVQGPKIAPDRLAAGDLVFFGTQGNVSHVGIYVGEGRFVHAPSSGGTVRLDALGGAYWRDHYTGAKRVLR
jgi:cell wall-associated NlpC family hydrolase